MKYNIKDLIGKKYAVLVNEAQWDKIMIYNYFGKYKYPNTYSDQAISLEDGCHTSAAWYREHGLEVLNFEDLIFEDDFVLPNKWFVYYKNREQFDILKAFYNKDWHYCDPKEKPRFGYYSTTSDDVTYNNNWVNSYNSEEVKKEHTEITWEQFEKYVLNQKQTNMKITGYKVVKELPDIAVGTVGELVQQGKSRIFGFKATSGWQHRRYYEDVIQKSTFFEAIYEKTEVTFTLGTPARRFTIKEAGKITCQSRVFTLDEIRTLYNKLEQEIGFGPTAYYFDNVQIGCKADGVRLKTEDLQIIITKIQEYGK